MTKARRLRSRAAPIWLALVIFLAVPAAAQAYEFTSNLSVGDTGRDVRALEIRVAGWFPRKDQTRMKIDKWFSHRTKNAVKRFQHHYGLVVDGIAGPQTFDKLGDLENADGSTKHFDWSEFKQHKDPSCSAKANSYAGTFKGGRASHKFVQRRVKRMMWRLEAIRAKAGNEPVGVNSGFRSVEYNDCIGGASSSQHMYGTAADNRIADISNHRERTLARKSQIEGIECYSDMTHNHFDIRIENSKLDEQRTWWWYERDKKGHDLTPDGSRCWGESGTGAAPAGSPSAANLHSALILSPAQVKEFANAGEPSNYGSGD
jgi:uncharacterized protein YcbK (DUF882 family)